MKEEIRETAGLEVGDTIFFIADNEKNAALYAGQIRTALGERLDLIERTHLSSVISMISQCMNMTRKQRRWNLLITHSQCHRVDWKL